MKTETEKLLKTEKINFWTYWKSLSKRQKNYFKRKFMEHTGIGNNTLNAILQRKNFTLEEEDFMTELLRFAPGCVDFSDPEEK